MRGFQTKWLSPWLENVFIHIYIQRLLMSFMRANPTSSSALNINLNEQNFSIMQICFPYHMHNTANLHSLLQK